MDKILQQIDEWKKRLIDLSKRNQLIYFDIAKKSVLEIENPNSENIFNGLNYENSFNIWLPPKKDDEEDGTSEKELLFESEVLEPKPKEDEIVFKLDRKQDIEKRLKSIYRRATSDYQEKGLRTSAIAMGLLYWKETDNGDEICSPLIIFPVEISQATPEKPYKIEISEEEAVLNPAIQVKLNRDFKIDLQSPDFNSDKFSIGDYFRTIEKLGKKGGWRVEDKSVLGIFSFHKIAMYQDLSLNANSMAENPIIQGLTEGYFSKTDSICDIPKEIDLDNNLDLARMLYILDADSSQSRAIEAAIEGHSFVLKGPPGTGKSQTICNIIAEFLEAGRTILFVSEKMAALEVVYNRLKEAQLIDFCLELHSHKANKKAVVKELMRCLEFRPKANNKISEIEFEKLGLLKNKLNGYVKELHIIREPIHKSMYEVFSVLANLEEIPLIVLKIVDESYFSPRSFIQFDELVSNLENSYIIVEQGNTFPWRGFHPQKLTSSLRSELTLLFNNIKNNINNLNNGYLDYTSAMGLEMPKTLSGYLWIIHISEIILKNPSPLKSWISDGNDSLMEEAKKYCSLNEEYNKIKNEIINEFPLEFIPFSQKIADTFKLTWNKVIEQLPSKDETGKELISKYQDTLEFLDVMINLLNRCKKDICDIQNILDIRKTEEISLRRVEQITELASLIESKDKPEAHWLNPEAHYKVMETYKRIKMPISRYQIISKELNKRYNNHIYELDLQTLINNFENRYKGILKYLKPRYYVDKDKIKKTSLVNTVPLSIVEDLKYARESNNIKEGLENKGKELISLFGNYYDGVNTNLESTELALETASKIVKLTGELPLPTKLINLASFGGVTPPDFNTIAKRLRNSLNDWQDKTQKFNEYLSLNRLKTTNLPAVESSISSLEEFFGGLQNMLLEFKTQLTPINLMRNGRDIPSVSFILDNIEKAKQISNYEMMLKEESDKLESKYGSKFAGVETNWGNIIDGLVWAREFMKVSNEVPLADEFIDNVCKGIKPNPLDLETLRQSYNNASNSIESLTNYFNNMDNYFTNDGYSGLTIDQIINKIEELNNRIEDLKLWFDYVDIIKEMKHRGLSEFIDKLIEIKPKRDQLRNTFLKAYYHAWAESVCSKVPLLGEFRGSIHSKLIEEFRSLDKKLNILSTTRIIEKLNETMPSLINIRGSEVSKIRSEAAKKARHWPLKKLFNEIPNLLLKLKPCLLMSPLSVSHYLDKQKYNFDLVIFDEASQICSEDAVGAIARGKQLIVAGDNRQLPPTKFFQSEISLEDDFIEDDSDIFDIYQSVLDDCERIGLTPEPLLLKWHYRSRHESLIAYSNSKFYENRLITFPSAMEKSDDLGVKFIFIPDGVYDKGGKRNNVKEAEKVAELVIEHFTKYGDQKTLGVATLNLPQRDLIMDVLWQKIKERCELAQYFQEDRLSGFFVKNLESVQGDERDVIILSLGYGKDAQGNFSMNFGPLNKDGGERRLNVIITRAKEKTIVVSSIKAGDFIRDNIKSEGVQHLYQYLDYAERGKEALSLIGVDKGESESCFEDEVKSEINVLGYTAISQVGCSNYRIDLGILDPANPGNFMLGIECDGRTYHSAFTARERDRIRQDVLEKLGWKIYRIWSTDWFHNKKHEINKLRTVLKAASENIYSGGDIIIPEEVKIIYTPNNKENILDGTIDYVIFKSKNQYPSYEFNTIGNYLLRRNILKNIVKAEAPIHVDLAGKRLISTWGINRMGSIIQETISNTIQNCIREKLIYKKGDFLWDTNSFKITHIRIPKVADTETVRDPEYVCPEEMQAAILLITRKAIGIDQISLFTETARLFGWNRSSERVEKAISKAFKKLLTTNSIIIENNNVRIC